MRRLRVARGMDVALRTRGLTRRFGALVALDALDLEVRQGEVFGLLGPNGAGKTTAIRMMTGLLAPTSGSVEVLGRDVAREPETIRRHVGVCPQENVLWMDLTCLENLVFLADMYGLPRDVGRRRAEELLARMGLAEKAGARADALSGGMKRRLTIASALVHDPDVVVLDEPEAGLDPQARVVVREFVRELRGRKTVLLTTHNMDEAERLADRIGVVDRGRLIALDTSARLKSTVGEGDVLELRLAEEPGPLAARLEALGVGSVHVSGNEVLVRGLDLARRFPQVMAEVERSGAKVEDVRYRQNTLEDVFISLTGRGLRD